MTRDFPRTYTCREAACDESITIRSWAELAQVGWCALNFGREAVCPIHGGKWLLMEEDEYRRAFSRHALRDGGR